MGYETTRANRWSNLARTNTTGPISTMSNIDCAPWPAKGDPFDDFTEKPTEEIVKRIISPTTGSTIGVITIAANGTTVLSTRNLLIGDIDDADVGGDRNNAYNAIDRYYTSSTGCLGLRVYDTCAGVRFFITNKEFDGYDDNADKVFNQIGCIDEVYRTLCSVQGTFRARLTPKPDRIGMVRRYDESPENSEEWMPEYQRRCQMYAVANTFYSRGGYMITPDNQHLIDIHDEYCVTNEENRLDLK